MHPAERPVRIVAIDDDPVSLALIQTALKDEAVEVFGETDPAAGMERVFRDRPQVVLLDLMLPGVTGMELLERIVDALPETDVILITGHYSTDSAVEAIRKGAADYLTKPISVELFRQRVAKFVGAARERDAALRADTEVLRAYQFEGMVGRSPLMLQVFARIRRVAPHFQTVLVTGATGSGKELAARALHRLSPAASARFAVCNCSAVVETLFESELFGHVKGAFTGATQDKMGLFEYANGGIVFLDEIGDMPFDTQSKLLRVLENREVQRVGSPAVRTVDVRVIAATNRDLPRLMREGRFREDLYYRLAMVEIRLPELAERKEDLPLLERHFLQYFAGQYGKPIRGMTPRAEALLNRYPWPGNVRELRSAIGSACMLAEGDMLDTRDFPEYLHHRPEGEVRPETGGTLLTLEEVERRHVARVLQHVGGNKKQAARILGIHRSTMHRYLAARKEDAASANA